MNDPIARVLVEDPDLAHTLDAAQREEAERACVARTVMLEAGTWSAPEFPPSVQRAVGLLLLDGLMMRRVGRAGRFGAELLGAGDILRPWEHDGGRAALPLETEWRILEPVRVAVLDVQFANRASRYPELTGQLVGRAMQRSRVLAAHMAIVHHTKVDTRLQMLFWHLADRWGRVTPDGVTIDIRLAHHVLADLVAAQRPSVSTALSRLARRELVQWTGEHWLLRGGPPDEFASVGEVAGTPLSVSAS